MSVRQGRQAVAVLDRPKRRKPRTVVCSHCHGKGECFCRHCGPSIDVEGAHRDDFDTGRQLEGTCRFCAGLGRTSPDGQALISEPYDE